MAVKFANLASSTLASSLTNSATSISATDASSFPSLGAGDYFYASIGEGSLSEIVKVTAVSSNTFTAVRGQDGTTARSHDSGTSIALRVVAAALDDISSQAQTAADTESVSIAGDTMTGDLSFGDDDKIIFGSTDNFKLFHDGTTGFITSSTSNIELKVNGGGNFKVGDEFGNHYLIVNDNGDVQLYHGQPQTLKLATSSTGIDVTGTVTADALQIDGAATITQSAGSDFLKFDVDGTTDEAILGIDSTDFIIDIDPTNVRASSNFIVKNDGTTNLTLNSSGDLDVNGTVTADTLDIDSVKIISGQSTTPTNDGSPLIYKTASHSDYANGDLIIQARSSASRDIYMLTGTTTPVNRLQVNGNGDISFYEHTGTTAKLQWLASDEDLKFADNSKAIFGAGSDLVIYHEPNHSIINESGTGSLKIQGDNIRLQKTDGSENMITCANDGAVTLFYNSAQRLATVSAGIDVTGTLLADTLETSTASGGNINIIRDDPTIGTDNSLGAISWKSTEDSGTTVNTGASIVALAGQNHSTVASGSYLIFNTTAVSSTSPTEKVRLTSDGNLLVGKTSVDNTTQGVRIYSTGRQSIVSEADTALIVNRRTSDGPLAEFRKDGTSAGQINARSGDLVIGTGTTGLQFYDVGNAIFPLSASGNTNRDAAIDLGEGSNRFKDLYLSGSAFVGTQLRAGGGSESLPSVSFSDDSDSGMFRATTNALGFSTAGTERIRITSDGKVGISTDDPSTALDVAGTVTSDGLIVAGDVSVDGGTIKLDGNFPTGNSNLALGNNAGTSIETGAQHNVLIGNDAGDAISTGDFNTCVGSLAGTSYVGTLNSVAVGYSAGQNSVANDQVLIGAKSGQTGPAFGAVGVGYETLMSSQSSAYRLVAVGYRSFRNNTTGDNNVGVGYQAGASHTTTSNNTYIGAYAGDGTAAGNGYNVAVGTYSMTGNLSTGNGYNTCVGGRSGLAISSGSDNTLIGYNAGDAVSTGYDNTAVGYNALSSVNTENGNVAIGHSALSVAYSTVESTCVGNGAGSAITTGSKNTILGAYNGNEDGLDIRALSNRIVLADGDGAVGMYIDNSQDAHFDGNVVAYSTTISDRRLKSQITPISSALNKVDQINGVTFVRDHNGEKAAGVIAQEIMEVLPEAVKSQALPLQTGNHDEKYYVVEYDAVTGLLVEAVKELKARVEALESK